MFPRSSTAAVLLCTSLTFAGGALAGTPGQFHISTTPVTIDHVTIVTSTPFQLVASRLDSEVNRFDESYRVLLNKNELAELRGKLTEGLKPDDFMIHFIAQQGDLLALEGMHRRGNVYYLGNVLAAVQMTKVKFSAALYAPLRLNVYENENGGTTFEYDRPSTEFGQFHDADINKVARALDDHLLNLIRKVSS